VKEGRKDGRKCRNEGSVGMKEGKGRMEMKEVKCGKTERNEGSEGRKEGSEGRK
jgi:hypothetical protein